MKKIRILLSLVMISITAGVFAQGLNEAGAAFNEGIKFSKEDQKEAAVNSYKKCISICEQLGEEGDDLKLKSKNQIASLYTSLGISAYKRKKPDEAITHLEQSIIYAEQAGDSKAVDKSNKYLGYVYSYKGNTEIKNEAYDNALENLNKAITYYPNNIKTYYSMGLAYMKKGDEVNMKQNFDKVIAMGKEDDKTVVKTRSTASNYFIARAGKAIQAGNNEDAIRLVNESLNYTDGDGNTYYYLALAYNNTKQFDKGIEAAEKGLTAEPEDTSNLHFEAARAYEGKGDNAKACEHYKRVTSGPNVEAAKYQMGTVLTCN